VTSLMGPAVVQPGKFAHWISPPARGINGQPGDFRVCQVQLTWRRPVQLTAGGAPSR